MVPGRDREQADHSNRDYVICHAAGNRLLRAALAHLITGRRSEFKQNALAQMSVLFDESKWPEWRDLSHQQFGFPADLRTGMLSTDVALAYDWLHPALSERERNEIVEGIDRCGIRPFLKSIEMDPWWTTNNSNWLTCIVGGLGIAAMVLGAEHPKSDFLIDYSLTRMRMYLEIYGPLGEFNESIGYANASSLAVGYFMAYAYLTDNHENLLAEHPFPQTCRWFMYMTLPPGRMAAFGDTHADAPPFVKHVAAVANAANDEILQWYYLQQATGDDDPRQLLWYDPQLEPRSPQNILPLGNAFPANGGCISSRTDWDLRETACVVYSKAGREAVHEHNDVGQLCIDGYGERLIIDMGSPSSYPADFFTENRWQYYNASARGHNVFLFGDRDMKTGEHDRGKILDAQFDRGAWRKRGRSISRVRTRARRSGAAHGGASVAGDRCGAR